MRKQSLLLATAMSSILGNLPQQALALTMEQRMRAMERRMQQLEGKLQRTGEENERLRQRLTTKPPETRRQDIEALDTKIDTVDRKLERDWAVAVENAKKYPVVETGKSGLSIKSADENWRLGLKGNVQADSAFFLNNSSGDNIEDKFYIKRARLNLEGTLFKYIDFRLGADFANSQLRLFDAIMDVHYFPAASLSFGKFRQPVSLERWQSTANLVFVERAYPAMMAPNRDIGVMLHGQFGAPGYVTQYTLQPVFKEFLPYELGVFNGLRDNQTPQNADTERDNNKEFAGRFFMHPFLHSGGVLEGIGLGLAGTWGQPKENPLFSLVSPGQSPIVNYTGTSTQSIVGTSLATTSTIVTSSGESYRIYPQMYWYWGPFGVLAEYLISSQQLHGVQTQRIGTTIVSGPNTNVRQDNQFAGVWGALQMAFRWSELDIGDATLKSYRGLGTTTFFLADPKTSVSHASSWALGLNWYLNDYFKVMANYEQTDITGGASRLGRVVDRETERVFITRFQFAL